MSKRLSSIIIILILSDSFSGQVNLGGFMKDKADGLKDKLKDKAKEKAGDILDTQRKQYDESNFNYAISFTDNSGIFEAEEKGSTFANDFLNGARFAKNEEKSTEDRAYTNLKNGELLMAGNKYYLAEQCFKLSKLLYEEAGKTGDGNYAQVIGNLGLLYQSRGRFNKAAKFSDLAIKLRESGNNEGMLVASINNRAVLKKETGNYTEAETELKKALEKAKKQNNELAVALINNNLAMTYLDMNRLKDAEHFMNEGINGALKTLKENSGNYIKLQINLANIYRLQKKYTQAEGIYLKAIATKEKKLGVHPDLAHLKRGLAQLYMETGNSIEVEKLLISAYEIDKQKLGENNPATLSVRQELANYYRFNNNPEKSFELINSVVSAKKTIYGANHPNYVQSLEDLALTQWVANKKNECKGNYKIVIGNTLEYINTYFNSLNDSEKTLYWEKTSARLQRFFSFAQQNQSDDPELLKQFYNVVINTKGFLLSNSSKIRNAIFSGGDENIKRTYDQWLETKEQLNLAYQLSLEEQIREKINVDSLKGRAGELERELSQKSALFKQSIEEKPVAMEQVQASLKPGECAIEIVEISDYVNGFTGKESYTALILTAAGLKIANLGKGSELEAAVLKFREKTINIQPESEAYSLTWKKIDEQIKGVSKIYLALDGVYHQLSVIALKDPAGKFLADKYTIQLLSNTGEIGQVKRSEMKLEKPSTAFLIGNPLYGNGGVIEQLPGTEKEVNNINKLLNGLKINTTLVIGAQAKESKIKTIQSPGILHLATHGYFLPDVGKMETTKVLGVDIAAAKENPLLRSGLLLASCENVLDENFKASLESENGILTAYEAISLNLDKTDLVVLSACETGLGSVKQGEGVYGLQRAFLIAGAKSIMMSLWSVSDEATMDLMTFFYSSYVKSANKTQAFSEAVKQLKLKYKEPFYWGAFVMLSN